jgi:hypothetical protein
MDAKYGYIDTTEREDICDAFDLLVYACGLKRRKNLAEKWRNWQVSDNGSPKSHVRLQ